MNTEAEGQSLFVPFLLVVLTLGVLAGGWKYARSAPPLVPPPPPGLTPLPVSAPAPTPGPQDAGGADYQAGMAALRATDFNTALKLLRQAISAANRPDYRMGLAEALEKSGAPPDQFLAEYEAGASIAPVNVRYTQEWAKALNRVGRNADAIRVYQQAVQLQPDNLSNLRELSNLYMRSNNFVAARPYLEKVVELQPGDLALRQDFARSLEAAQDVDGAIKQYQAILIELPSADASRALLSEAYMKQNKSDDALRVLNEGIARNASAALLYREKGRLLDRLGNAPEAIAAYREYVRLAPGATDLRAFTDRIQQLSEQGDH